MSVSWIKNFDATLVQFVKQIIETSCELDQPIKWKDATKKLKKKICSVMNFHKCD